MIARLAASPDRRAVIATTILAAIVLGLVVAALLAWSALGRQADLIEDRLFELQSIAQRVKARGPGIARAERALAADPFLPGATPTLAANALQRRIVGVAEDCGVTLRTIGAEPAADVAPGTLPPVTVQTSANARIAALQKFLYRLETEAPFVLVDEVTLRAPQSTAVRGLVGRDPVLEVDLRLIGYLRRGGGEP